MAGIAALITPREPMVAPRTSPNRFNVRLREIFSPGNSRDLDPTVYTDQYALGKPPQHAASMATIALTSDRESLTHQRDAFIDPLEAPSPHASTPRGQHNPYRGGRVNIARNPAG